MLPGSDRDKNVEILALRHQITVLQRQLGPQKIRFEPADRALLAALLHPLPRPTLRSLRLLVHPDTVPRWRRDMLARRHTSVSRPTRRSRPPPHARSDEAPQRPVPHPPRPMITRNDPRNRHKSPANSTMASVAPHSQLSRASRSAKSCGTTNPVTAPSPARRGGRGRSGSNSNGVSPDSRASGRVGGGGGHRAGVGRA